MRKFLKVEPKKFHFLKYKKFFKSGFFLFFEIGSLLPKQLLKGLCFLKYKEYFWVSISRNIRKFFGLGFFVVFFEGLGRKCAG